MTRTLNKIPSGKTFKRSDIKPMADQLHLREVDNIFGALAKVKLQADTVHEQVSGGFTCEDPKLLEVIIEHILLHWDDIMAVLIDELV
jgi:hypothetical protein